MAAKTAEDPLAVALASIAKDFGAGAVMTLGSGQVVPVEVIPTGSLALDRALGTGGIPRGRIIELYGPEGAGKSTIALSIAARAQALALRVAYIDAEHALDPDYARALGVDADTLLISQPDCGEDALEIADRLASSGGVGLIVVDSVAALVPRAELEGAMGDAHVGLQARLMSQALRKMTGHLADGRAACVFINQLREKIGISFGSPETTPGGKALKYYASVRLDVRRIETLKEGTEAVGSRLRVKVVKNKLASPFRHAEFSLLFGRGIDRADELLDLGVAAGCVAKDSAHRYSLTLEGLQEPEHIGHGHARARDWLAAHPDVAARVEAVILAMPYRPLPAAPAVILAGDGPAPWDVP